MLSDSEAAHEEASEEAHESLWKRNRSRILIIGIVALVVVVGTFAYQKQSQPLDDLAVHHQSLERQEPDFSDFSEDNFISLEDDDTELNSDIAFGRLDSTKRFPFVTRLSIGPRGGVCTGEIIKRDWILTAKHCVRGKSPSSVTVFAGSDHRNNAGGQRRKGKRIVLHPKMDAALVQLQSKFHLNRRVRPVQWIAYRVPYRRYATAAGWGATGKGAGHGVSTRLKSATMKIKSRRFCRRHGRKPGRDVKNYEICTKGGSGNTCGGDSGGPLVSRRRRGWMLVGINSWSKTSCSSKKHNVDVFQNVARFRRWLFRTVGRRKCSRKRWRRFLTCGWSGRRRRCQWMRRLERYLGWC